VSKRSKRRRGPQKRDDEGAARGGRRAEPTEAGESGRPGEARDASGGRASDAPQPSGGRAGEAGQASGRSGVPRQASGRSGAPRQASGRGALDRSGARAPARRAGSDWSLGVQLAFLAAVFAVVVVIAELAGAANLGVALGVGQIAFAIAVIYLLVRR
jgi:hypothetical protein